MLADITGLPRMRMGERPKQELKIKSVKVKVEHDESKDFQDQSISEEEARGSRRLWTCTRLHKKAIPSFIKRGKLERNSFFL
jgi:hypothetical protein